MLDSTSPDSPSSRSSAEGPKIAPILFNRDDADVVLSSSDGTHFRAHRQILSIASPLFETMFSLPQPQRPTSLPGSLPVVAVEEDARTLENLLRILYPVRDPQLSINVLTDWQHISNITHAALKYDAVQAVDFMKARLTTGVDSFPLDVFCVACKHGLENVAKSAAARLAVDKPGMLTDYVPLLEDIPAGCYHRLLRALDSPTEDVVFCRREDGEQADTIVGSSSSYYRIRDPSDVDPSRHVVQTADKVYYDMSAESFSIFESSQAQTPPTPPPPPPTPEADFDSTLGDHTSTTLDGQNNLTLNLPEESKTVDLLLRVEDHDSNDPELIALGLRAAVKYEAERARRVLARHWLWHARRNPLQSYLIATAHGLKDEAISSARQLLTWGTQKLRVAYDPAMEYISAGHYYRLLQYRETCMKVACDSMQELWENAFPPAITRSCRGPTYSDACTENTQSRWVNKCFCHIQALKQPCRRDIAQDAALVGELCFQAASCRHCVKGISSTDIVAILAAYVKANEEAVLKVDTAILFKKHG
ncbi:hypothetical protein FOMPIDRAFT_1047409 [Fomitopsis schrenkii]|uniref:BTB domain-containing protein n=1 Tax=Fomitopsis schrenkii TaxID=2126942 RepID=S8EDH4_FOMSC|nr:hypothetical protein FOMPIDRAFT_1047409 [Fomitopsis schrenkii]